MLDRTGLRAWFSGGFSVRFRVMADGFIFMRFVLIAFMVVFGHLCFRRHTFSAVWIHKQECGREAAEGDHVIGDVHFGNAVWIAARFAGAVFVPAGVAKAVGTSAFAFGALFALTRRTVVLGGFRPV